MPDAVTANPPPAIRTLEALRIHLQAAVELEHSTIPPYLTALYSLRPGCNRQAAENIRTVVVGEMLHMVLAANVLNAVGGAPNIDDPRFVPTYPAKLPVGRGEPIEVHILRFSPRAIETFLEIESPAHPPAPRTPLLAAANPVDAGELLEALRKGWIYASIGDFYAAIEDGLKQLEGEAQASGITIFTGAPERQVGPRYYYNAGGAVVEVSDLATALKALREIVDQGEGYGDTINDGDNIVFHQPSERAHYYRFNEIAQQRRYGPGDKPADKPSGAPMPVDYSEAAVYPMMDDPDPKAYRDADLRALSDRFGGTYTTLLKRLHTALNGRPTDLVEAVGLMFNLRDQAVDLMRNPVGDGACAGPTYRFIPSVT